MELKIYNNKESSPKPNQPILPGSCAVILNKKNEILLIKRDDSDLWSLPGGTMELGESIAQCCLREVKEETRLDAKIKKLIGIYTSPEYIFEWKSENDSKVWQSFVVAFLLEAKSEKVELNQESTEYKWFDRNKIKGLKTFPCVREIIFWAIDEKGSYFD